MVHNVKNVANIVGVRPGHDGTQFIKHNQYSNSAGTMYTIPAGKILLLTNVTSHARATAGTPHIEVKIVSMDVADVYYNAFGIIELNISINRVSTFDPPFELIPTSRIDYVVQSATTLLSISLRGILVDSTGREL
jgi:hypothetical protein